MANIKDPSKIFFIIICVIGFFAILSSTMSKNPVLKPFATNLGTPTDLLGFIAAASTIPGMLISLPAASLSDVYGRKRVLIFSAFIFASAPFLYLGVTVWWQLALVRFYHGFATSIFVPVVEATLAEVYPAQRGERMALFNSATAVGRALAPFLGGFILFATNYNFFTLYTSVGIAGLTVLIMAAILLLQNRNSLPSQGTAKKEGINRQIIKNWDSLTKNRMVLALSFVQSIQYYVFGAVEFFLVGYMIEVVGLDAFSIGIIMGSQIVALIIVRPLMGRFSDRAGRAKPIILGSFFASLLLLAIPYATQFVLLLLVNIAYGTCFATVISSTSPMVCDRVPASIVGTSMGFIATAMDVGQTLGPIISGFILAISLNYTPMFVSLSILLVMAIVVFVSINKSEG